MNSSLIEAIESVDGFDTVVAAEAILYGATVLLDRWLEQIASSPQIYCPPWFDRNGLCQLANGLFDLAHPLLLVKGLLLGLFNEIRRLRRSSFRTGVLI